MERGKLLISKDYWPNKPIKINLEAPNFNLEQIQFRESYLKAHYKNKQIFIDKFFSKLIEGKFPNYSQVIPKDNKKKLEIDLKLFFQK